MRGTKSHVDRPAFGFFKRSEQCAPELGHGRDRQPIVVDAAGCKAAQITSLPVPPDRVERRGDGGAQPGRHAGGQQQRTEASVHGIAAQQAPKRLGAIGRQTREQQIERTAYGRPSPRHFFCSGRREKARGFGDRTPHRGRDRKFTVIGEGRKA
jgi:hypothetical protein